MSFHLTITIGSHFFKINKMSSRGRIAVVEFAKRYVRYGLVKNGRGGFKREPQAVFAAATKERDEYRFHINQLEEFKTVLGKYNLSSSTEWIKLPIPEGQTVDIPVKDGWELREKQVPAQNFLMKSDIPGIKPELTRSRLIELQPGAGKTSLTMMTASKWSKRFMVIIRPMYLEKWARDITNILNVRQDQVLVVQGGKQLQALLHLAETDQLGDNVAIVMSNKTFQIWLKTYAKFGELSNEMGYLFPPDEYYEKTGIGLRVNDEVHLDIHLQFLIDLYTNCNRSVGLSGSFVTTDSFLSNIQAILYPPQCRYNEDKLDKYVTATAVFYNIRNPRQVKTEYYGSTMYSHTAFEESVMKNNQLFAGYTGIVETMIEKFFMSEYKPGERCLVFCASKEMCGRFQVIFQRRYPHLKVSRYVDDDPYENLMESDLIFSTVLSAGTAHDVPKLKTAIMTISLESLASNIQAFGRLRNIPDIKTRFVYLVCLDLQKQVAYHKSKKELLLSRAKTYGEHFIQSAI